MGIPIYFIYSLSFLPARCMPLYTAKCHASIFPRRKASYRRKYIFYFQRRIGIKDTGNIFLLRLGKRLLQNPVHKSLSLKLPQYHYHGYGDVILFFLKNLRILFTAALHDSQTRL